MILMIYIVLILTIVSILGEFRGIPILYLSLLCIILQTVGLYFINKSLNINIGLLNSHRLVLASDMTSGTRFQLTDQIHVLGSVDNNFTHLMFSGEPMNILVCWVSLSWLLGL